jgi:hypothetical protein
MSASPSPSPAPAPATKYYASISGKPSDPLPDEFVTVVRKLEAALKAPLWLLIQNSDMGDMGNMDGAVYRGFETHDLRLKKIALSRCWWNLRAVRLNTRTKSHDYFRGELVFLR